MACSHYLRNNSRSFTRTERGGVIGNREDWAADIVRIAMLENMTRGNGRIDVNICINHAPRRDCRQPAGAPGCDAGVEEDIDDFERELLIAMPDPDR
jgi:hypothetical protein